MKCRKVCSIKCKHWTPKSNINNVFKRLPCVRAFFLFSISFFSLLNVEPMLNSVDEWNWIHSISCIFQQSGTLFHFTRSCSVFLHPICSPFSLWNQSIFIKFTFYTSFSSVKWVPGTREHWCSIFYSFFTFFISILVSNGNGKSSFNICH